MGKPLTNQELVRRCYAATHIAADKVSALESRRVAFGTIAVSDVQELRNVLREAFCAAQELKHRLKA